MYISCIHLYKELLDRKLGGVGLKGEDAAEFNQARKEPKTNKEHIKRNII